MSRISKHLLIALLLIAFITGARADEMLIADEDIVRDTANYKTATVELGAYRKTVTTGASEYYPTQYAVKYKGAGARYVDTVVKRGTEVKKGDLIAIFEAERDDVRVAQSRLALQRLKEDYAKERAAWETRLEDKRKQYAAEANSYTAEIMRIEYKRMELEYQLFAYRQERTILTRQDALDELLESYQNERVYAPADGVVYDVTYFKDGQKVYDGTVIAHIYDPLDIMFYVEDESDAFRYNMPVTVEVGVNKSRVSGTGRVVASYNALPTEADGNSVYIRVTDYDENEVTSLMRPSVKADSVYLGNVTMVNRSAVSLFGGKYFVYKLTDGQMVSKRYVNFAAGTQTTGAWILQGVEPGDVLILD